MPESRLQHDAIKYLERRGAYVVNTWGTPLAHSGVPDLLVCYRGFFVAFELKYGVGKTSAAQKFHLKSIAKADGLCFVAWEIEDVQNALDTVDAQ